MLATRARGGQTIQGLVARCERSGERRLACETFRDGQIDNATSDYHHELRNCISYEVMNLMARPLFKRWMSPGQTGYDALTPLLFQPISADKRDRRPSRRVSTGGLRASGDGLRWTRGATPCVEAIRLCGAERTAAAQCAARRSCGVVLTRRDIGLRHNRRVSKETSCLPLASSRRVTAKAAPLLGPHT